ncbi:MAG: cation diffusion facilitator family transporter [Rhodocyclaceae bacterium]|nr:cation diffusion facilitator family transporter [Rhodocyclaceae bacterium]
MSHDHSHHHGHAHGHTNYLPAALSITLLYAAVEAGAGWWAGSLALLSDAGHMLTDALALALAAAAAWAARRPPTPRLSFGLQRIEILAALGNAGFMLAVIIGIAWSAADRLLHPVPVQGAVVTAVALLGLAINIGVAWLLAHGESTLNTRAALLHVMGDLLGSVAALASGLVIQYTGWTPADPLLSLFICALILFSTLRLAREAVHYPARRRAAGTDFAGSGTAHGRRRGRGIGARPAHLVALLAPRRALRACRGARPRSLAAHPRRAAGTAAGGLRNRPRHAAAGAFQARAVCHRRAGKTSFPTLNSPESRASPRVRCDILYLVGISH